MVVGLTARRRVTRRRLLVSAGAAGAGAAARSAASSRGSSDGRRARAASGDGASCRSTATHQAGIATPPQDRLLFAVVRPDHRATARTSRDLLRTWTDAGRADDAGPAGRAPDTTTRAPPARHRRGGRAARAARLTVTFGFGPSLFEPPAGPLRPRDKRAARAAPICRRCPGDELDPRVAAATSACRPAPTIPQVAFHAVRNLARARPRRRRHALVAARLRPHLVDEHARRPRRATCMGFKDGTNNIHARGRRERAGEARLGRRRRRPGLAARRQLPGRPAHPHADRGLGPRVARRPGADDRPRARSRARRSAASASTTRST